MANLKEIYSKAYECSASLEFSTYNQYDECISSLNTLAKEIPKNYKQYKEVQSATASSIKRIEIQKEITYSQYKSVDQFIKARGAHQLYRNEEQQNWQELEIARVQNYSPKDPNVVSDNLINMFMIGSLVLIIFIYRLFVSNKLPKLKYVNILKSFELMEEASLVRKEIFPPNKYKTIWFGLRSKDENEGITFLTPEESRRINLIYENMYILEEAFYLDISENKINIWKGVNLNNEYSRAARARFLNIIHEKVKE